MTQIRRGKRLWYDPITTNNQRNNSCENRMQKDERLIGVFSGIPFAALLRLSHPNKIISVDLMILHLCSYISVQINKSMQEYDFCFFYTGLQVYVGLKLYLLLQYFSMLTWVLKCYYLSLRDNTSNIDQNFFFIMGYLSCKEV